MNLASPHLWNVSSETGLFLARTNNGLHFGTTANEVGFVPVEARLGWGTGGNKFNGVISEVMIFDRPLSDAEREAVRSGYLNQRYELW